MAEDINTLVLEHVRAVRADLRGVGDILSEHGHRLTRIEIGLASLRRDHRTDAAGVAEMGLRLDRLGDKVQQIERRLEILD